MTKSEMTATVALTGIVLVAVFKIKAVRDRKRQEKFDKSIAETQAKWDTWTKEFSNQLDQLDKQLEVAKFWDQVTQD